MIPEIPDLNAVAAEADTTLATVGAVLAELRGSAPPIGRRSRERERVLAALKRRGLLAEPLKPMSIASNPAVKA